MELIPFQENYSMIRKMNKTLAALAVSAAVTGASGLAQAADTIKIALAGPVTGPVAQYGDMQFTGAKMAVEQINQQGGRQW